MSESGEALKQQGISAALLHNINAVEVARKGVRIAALSNPDRTSTIDDAYEYLGNHPPYDLNSLRNAAGSVFKGNDFDFTGQWVPSKRASNHSRYIRVWKLRENAA